jgi:hypothetical protein
MFGKLVALLAQAKGAAAATVFIAGGVTATVAATNPEVQETVTNVTTSISTTLSAVTQLSPKCAVAEDAKNGGGQPEVVAQRNAADKLLRDAWNTDKKKLNDLRGGKDVDNKTANELVKKYDDQLKDRLDKALNDVAALTLGRNGQLKNAPSDGSGSAGAPADRSRSAGAPSDGSRSAKPTCAPSTGNPSDGSSAAAPRDGSSSDSPKDGTDSAKGRVAVANRTTLTADIKAIVDEAVKDMDKLVTDATKAMDEAKLAAPSTDRGGKPEDKGKPSDKPGNGNGNKPSGSPRS